MHDVDSQITTPLPYIFSANTQHYDIEYADDTLLLTRSSSRMQEIMNLVETEAAN